jgi:hypothetical protein
MATEYRSGRYALSALVRCATAALASLVVGALAAYAAETTPPGVLILHSNQRPTPAQVIIDDTLRAVVPQELKRPVNLSPGTIVFTPGYFVDGAGEVSTPRASAERIAQASVRTTRG